MAGTRGGLSWAAAVLAGVALSAGGCVHTQPGGGFGPDAAPAIAVPGPGAVPRELDKVTLPEYVIEPPDVLRLEAVVLVKFEDAADQYDKEARRREAAKEEAQTTPRPTGDVLRSLPLQPVWGEYTVRPDGTLYLGVYGSVPVAGLSMRQAAAAVREHLARQAFAEAGGIRPDRLLVVLDVTQYQSKKYYVITDGGGNGEQVYAFTPVGSETVLDALSNIYGLPAVASKRNIWVARRTPHVGEPEQILPVDWVGITQHGVAATNYQIMPGDRVYVKAQRIITLDTTLARVILPIERLLGVTLLGTSTVNQIRGRGQGF